MFNSSNTSSTPAPKFFTGLTSFTVLGVNPTKEEIESYLGREYKLNVNYDIAEVNNRSVRPIEIWLKDTGGFMDAVPMRFYVSTEDDIAATGSIRFVNDRGLFTYGKSREMLEQNPNMNWFHQHSFRGAKVGENELYTFMQRLMRYDSFSAEASFMEDAIKGGMTIDDIYNNRLTGLRKFFDWCNSNDNKIVAIAAVRSTSKMVNDEPRVYYNQTVVNNPSFYFQTSSGQVSARAIAAVKNALAKGERISKNLFTVEFQPFVKEECVNLVPDQVATTSSSYNPNNLI